MKARHAPLWGIFGRPYLDLSGVLDLAALDGLDAEVTRGLAHVEARYTGGTLKWMGVVAPWAMDDAYRDAMHVIESLPEAELDAFIALAEDPAAVWAALPECQAQQLAGLEVEEG